MPVTPQEAYTILQEASGFAVGQQVKVLRAVPSRAHGWGADWTPGKNAYVGGTFTITSIDPSRGIRLIRDGLADGHYFPFFVLERFQREYINVYGVAGYTARVYPDRIGVGCQSVSAAKLAELVEAQATITAELAPAAASTPPVEGEEAAEAEA